MKCVHCNKKRKNEICLFLIVCDSLELVMQKMQNHLMTRVLTPYNIYSDYCNGLDLPNLEGLGLEIGNFMGIFPLKSHS